MEYTDIAIIPGCESVALRGALGRVLARDVRSPLSVPGHANAAMAGYALRERQSAERGDAGLMQGPGPRRPGRPPGPADASCVPWARPITTPTGAGSSPAPWSMSSRFFGLV